MLASVGEQGYATTVVADVIAKAVASRKTFYEHFEDKHACFFAMSDEIASEWVERVERAEEASEDEQGAVEALVDELFALALESPAALRVLAVELTAAGSAGISAGSERSTVSRGRCETRSARTRPRWSCSQGQSLGRSYASCTSGHAAAHESGVHAAATCSHSRPR